MFENPCDFEHAQFSHHLCGETPIDTFGALSADFDLSSPIPDIPDPGAFEMYNTSPINIHFDKEVPSITSTSPFLPSPDYPSYFHKKPVGVTVPAPVKVAPPSMCPPSKISNVDLLTVVSVLPDYLVPVAVAPPMAPLLEVSNVETTFVVPFPGHPGLNYKLNLVPVLADVTPLCFLLGF
jgi:hypothetical protein